MGLEVDIDMMLAVPTYVFATPVFDGQAALSVAGAYGKVKVEADATLTGPNGTVLSGGYTYFNTKTGLPGPQRVLGIRRQESAGRLEHMANLVAAVWLMKQVTLKRTGVRAWSGSRLWAGGDP